MDMGVMQRMKPLVIGLALCAAAAAGAQDPIPGLTATDSVVQLDRIIAIVGEKPITQYDLQERLIALQQAPGFQPPRSEAEFRKLTSDVLNQIVDEEVLVQKALQLDVQVLDAELAPSVDQQIQGVRSRFPSEAEFRAELLKAGLGSPEEYRRFLLEQLRRTELQRRLVSRMRSEGKIPPVNVREAEVEAAFNAARATLPRRPATVTFRQIVMAPQPDSAARARARARTEALLAEINAGTDFERVARRESADSASRQTGGDLGWHRRGVMVPEFERWMFTLRPGQLSPVVETVHGFHIIRVDRVQPGEVKVRHVLIKPEIDADDIARAEALVDSVAEQWRAGAAFDTLAKLFHDYASGEDPNILTPIPVDSGLPPSYREAFAGKQAGDVVTFQIPGPGGVPKFVAARLITSDPGGEYTLAELRERVRAQLVEEGSIRRYLDRLRGEIFVSIRTDVASGLGEPDGALE